MYWSLIPLVLLVAAVFVLKEILQKQPKPKGETKADPPYTLKACMMSAAELEFYKVLQAIATPRLVVVPQVTMIDLVETPSGTDGYITWKNKVNQKSIDYVLCDANTMRPVVAVELDDATHRRADRRRRDTFVEDVMAQVGLPLARVPVSPNGYKPEDVAIALKTAIRGAPEGQRT